MTAHGTRPDSGPILETLESEAIEILREGVAAAERPVMLYSIGKDSSVLLHLARKAFWPAPVPFPLLHIDTGWKFREMIEFRDRTAAEPGLELRVHTNQEGRKAGINPFDHGSEHYTDVMKTEALRQALDAGRYDVVFGGARRDEERVPRQGTGSFFAPQPQPPVGPEGATPGDLEPSTTPACVPASRCASPRSPTGPRATSGATSPPSGSPSSRSTSRGSARSSSVTAGSSWWTTSGCPSVPAKRPGCAGSASAPSAATR